MVRSQDQPRAAKEYVFFYGTLLPRHAPPVIASTVRRLRRVGRGSVQGCLYDLGRYPGAVLSKTGPLIQGEVFELPDDPEILRRLDAFEGFDPAQLESSEFVRREWPVALQGGKRIDCWVYSYNRHPGAAPRIADGDFSKSRKSRA
jgi:gamma-glutamylcyclotransferase (GGCT)/AIG2-like uncharacterized protein YtfP